MIFFTRLPSLEGGDVSGSVLGAARALHPPHSALGGLWCGCISEPREGRAHWDENPTCRASGVFFLLLLFWGTRFQIGVRSSQESHPGGSVPACGLSSYFGSRVVGYMVVAWFKMSRCLWSAWERHGGPMGDSLNSQKVPEGLTQKGGAPH